VLPGGTVDVTSDDPAFLASEVLRVIGVDRKRTETAIQRINRLIREQLPDAPILTEATLLVSRRTLSLDELRAIKPWHERRKPKFLDVPLVLAEMGGRLILIDGANRRNHFLHIGKPGPFDALVIHLPTTESTQVN
jgi:hypothetical protein